MNPNDAYLYDQQYFDGYYLRDVKRETAYLQERDRIYEEYLKTHEFIGGNVLDVGCGIGGFMSVFDDRWNKYGVEPSEYASAKAAKKGILLVDMNCMDTEHMDLIVFRGTLQHIDYPMKVLYQATRLLKSNGLLVFLATPDTDSLVYKIWGTLPALDPQRNWCLFGHKELDNILERMGYKNKFLYPYLGTPYASPFKDLAKFFLSFIRYRKFAFPGNMMEIYSVKA